MNAKGTIRQLVHLARLGWVSMKQEAEEAEKTYAAIHAEIRAEVLAEVKTEVVAWLVKKAREQKTWDAGVLASKVDRGAVRAFIGTAHYRDARDEHRAAVLREGAGIADRLISEIEPADGETAFWRADGIRTYREALQDMAADTTTPTGGTPR